MEAEEELTRQELISYTESVFKSLPTIRFTCAELSKETGYTKSRLTTTLKHWSGLGILKKEMNIFNGTKTLYYMKTNITLDNLFSKLFNDNKSKSYNQIKTLFNCDLSTVKWFVNYYVAKEQLFISKNSNAFIISTIKPELDITELHQLLRYFYRIMPNLKPRKQNKWCI